MKNRYSATLLAATLTATGVVALIATAFIGLNALWLQPTAGHAHAHAHDGHPEHPKATTGQNRAGSKHTHPQHDPAESRKESPRVSAASYELPPHQGITFLEDVYDGRPFVVARDLGVGRKGAMGFDIQRRDAISSLGACSHWIVSCVDPEHRSLDECVAAAPTCDTDDPWNNDEHTFCCPAACAQDFSDARNKGLESIEAFTQVYFLAPSCFPAAMQLLADETTNGFSPEP